MATRFEGQGTGCQDRVALIPSGRKSVVAVLADGAGGTGGGGEAATSVVEHVRSALQEERQLDARGLRQLILEIGVDLESAGAGQSTAVIAVASPGRIVGASVGDSGAWLVEPTGWRDLTAGQPRKPLLGAGLAEPLIFTSDSREATLLLASDGVLNYAARERLLELLRRQGASPEACCASLIDAARLPNGKLQDDAAVAVVRLWPEDAGDLVASLSRWIEARSPGLPAAELGPPPRRVAGELERWIFEVLPRNGPLFDGGTDGVNLLENRLRPDGSLLIIGSVWRMDNQQLYPFEARLKLGEDHLESYELLVGDAAAREGRPLGRGSRDYSRVGEVQEWMIRVSRP